LIYTTLGVHTTFWHLLPALLVGGIGMAMSMSPLTSAAMGAVPVDKAGVGSAVINSMRQVGGSLGIAVMGAIVATQFHGAHRSPQAYVNGYHDALRVGAAIVFAGALVALATLRPPAHARRAAEAVAEAA
jgi:MFS family permease